MDSNTHHQQPHSGLLRFRSAPSSLFSGNNNSSNAGDSDSERLFSRFASNDSETSYPLSFQEFEDKSMVTEQASSPRAGYAALPPHYPRQSSFGSSDNLSFYGLVGSDPQQRQGKNASSNLVRQSSSPAGLFSNNNSVQNGFPFGGWNDPSNFAENLGGMRRDHDTNQKLFSGTQNGDIGNRVHMLSHHLSLPKNSAELAMEKFLQLQDSVPCKVRAKRGCATHPRSIAERVRRTRISERMRKLQELVPNMDKQTNTADMLDLAVDYIKELQKQFKSLSDNRVKCKCVSIQKPVPIR